MSRGPEGYLIHLSSGKLVHPRGGSSNPANDTPLVLYGDRKEGGERRLQVRFVTVPEFGHFGYIEHVASGKIVHPLGGSLTPGNDTGLVYHSDRHAGALFGFDEENEFIMHRGGKIWHPLGGSPNPGNNTDVVLHEARHDAARFYFVDTSMNRVSPYPSANLSGDWKIINAIIDPKATHISTYTVRYGRSSTKTVTEQHAWGISADVAKGLFSASATYAGFVERSNSDTWSEEIEETREITVTPGQSVVTWQYTFGIEQYGDEFQFGSNILADTNSRNVVPTL